MGRRNLTVQLDEDMIARAKIIAAKRGTSVSGLITRELQELVAEEERHEASWRWAREIVFDIVCSRWKVLAARRAP